MVVKLSLVAVVVGMSRLVASRDRMCRSSGLGLLCYGNSGGGAGIPFLFSFFVMGGGGCGSEVVVGCGCCWDE